MIRVTMQKNVSVNTGSYIMNMTHKGFFEWVEENEITEFLFRPSNPQNAELVERRISKVKKAGFEVSDSGAHYHYLKATQG